MLTWPSQLLIDFCTQPVDFRKNPDTHTRHHVVVLKLTHPRFVRTHRTEGRRDTCNRTCRPLARRRLANAKNKTPGKHSKVQLV